MNNIKTKIQSLIDKYTRINDEEYESDYSIDYGPTESECMSNQFVKELKELLKDG
jgi:hypothetical protein